jgi:hypothetical protein
VTIKVELCYGPLDGQTLNVAKHLEHIRIPVPGSSTIEHTPFDTQTKPRSRFWVAIYERWGFRGYDAGGRVFYRYVGQEEVRG